jgi:hypothetical protein
MATMANQLLALAAVQAGTTVPHDRRYDYDMVIGGKNCLPFGLNSWLRNENKSGGQPGRVISAKFW